MRSICVLVALTAGYFVNAQAPKLAERVGYADMEYIISQLPEVKEIQTEMKSTQDQLRTQIQEKSTQVEKQYQDFTANMDNMADSSRVNAQQQLEQAMGELEQMQRSAQNTLQNKQKLYMAPIYLKVSRAIDEVAKENGFSIILTNKVGTYSLLLYEEPKLNVSDLVLKKFGVTPAAK